MLQLTKTQKMKLTHFYFPSSHDIHNIYINDNYLAHEQLPSPVSVTGGASRVIKWNPTPKMINEMTTPANDKYATSVFHPT